MNTRTQEALKLALKRLERSESELHKARATIREALADSALDRMAENARDLGLDYEPPCKTGSQCTSKCPQCEQPAQQKPIDVDALGIPHGQPFQLARQPVAWRTFDGEGGYDYRTYDMNEGYAEEWDKQNPKHKGWVEPLYTSPQPSKPWVGLTRDERMDIINRFAGQDWVYAVEAIEAKLREKNNGTR